VQGNQIRVVLGVPKGTTDVMIIDQVNFKIWIRIVQAIDPGTKKQKGFREMNIRLIAWIDPIIDGHTGRYDTVGTVKNRIRYWK
jgi:hypothetical protein